MAKKVKSDTRPSLSASISVAVMGFICLIPVIWMILSAIQPIEELRKWPPKIIPTNITFDNFYRILADEKFHWALWTSLSVAAIVVAATAICSLLWATALSRFRFRGRTVMIVGVLVIQMIPAEALFISQYRMLSQFNLLNSILGLSLLYIGGVLPFVTWMLRGFVDGIPTELEEAAAVDGCSKIGAFMRISLPLLGPGIAATSIFAFLFAWNEYTLALVILSRDTSVTLPIWLQSFNQGMEGTDWGGIMAGATIVAIPVIILFILVQTRINQGMVAGAVKG